MVILLVVLTVIALIAIQYFLRRPAADAGRAPEREPAAPVDEVPPGVFVGPGHAWVHVERSGEVAIGAGRLPVALLGGVDRVEVKALGSEVRRGEPVAELHCGDRTIRLPSPVSGTISRVNPDATAHPRRVAQDPIARGWLLQVAPRGLNGALARMFVAEDAVAWIRSELTRLRDAIATLTGGSLAPATANLADGGVPVYGLAAQLPAEAWESLSEQFFAVESGPGTLS